MLRLALLSGAWVAAAKLPSDVSPALACLACNATYVEAAKLVNAHTGRMGLQNAVTNALDVVCAEGQSVFVTYSAPPLPMKKACFAILEDSDEAFEKLLLKKRNPAAAVPKLCRNWCDAAEDAPAAHAPLESLVKIDNKPLTLVKAEDGHFEAQTEDHDEL
jgi:hypothetical protein